MSFAFKRAHWAAVGFGTRVFKEAEVQDMTPARFDLLFVLYKHGQHLPRQDRQIFRIEGETAGWVQQGVLVEQLGVRPPTVSRMVDRLQELGLVERSESEADARQRIVAFTQEGWKRFCAALQVVFKDKRLARFYEKRLWEIEWKRYRRRWQRLEQIEGIVRTTTDIAHGLGDRAERIYEVRWRQPDWPRMSNMRGKRVKEKKRLTNLEELCICEGDDGPFLAYEFLSWFGRGADSGVKEPWYRPRRFSAF